MQDIHITKIVVRKPYDKVWAWISNPMNYPRIYPFWIAKIKEIEADSYEAEGSRGHIYKFSRVIEKKFGVVDLKIGEELSRTRLFPLNENNTVIIHLGVRWKQMKNPLFWFFYKRSVDKDFKNTKKIIENEN